MSGSAQPGKRPRHPLLPTRLHPDLQDALAELGARSGRFAPTSVRLMLADATVIEGSLVGVTDEHVSVGLGGSAIRRVPTGDIRILMLAAPDRLREWALAVVGILAATAALVGMVRLPIVGPYVLAHGADGFTVVFYVGVVALGVLLARTGLRRWLTRWRELYVAPDA